MLRREFLQLCQTFDPAKHSVAGWLISEKLDGMRAFWDGGISRGLPPQEVPWANTTKHGRYVVPPKATGLWTRYGQPIQAPGWFLDQLPSILLDGELYAGPGKFQLVTSVVKKLIPNDEEWKKITFTILDQPSVNIMFADGVVNVPMFKKEIKGALQWALAKNPKMFDFSIPKSFEDVLHTLGRTAYGPNVRLHTQRRLPFTTKEAHEEIERTLRTVITDGGEGVVLRNPIFSWESRRSHRALKHKPYSDDEAKVVGYIWGRETDLGSKLKGLMGAMVVSWKGKSFELSGFTDSERRMQFQGSYEQAFEMGCRNPGKPCEPGVTNSQFPIGTFVTFRYRELTNDGIPKEARYLRRG